MSPARDEGQVFGVQPAPRVIFVYENDDDRESLTSLTTELADRIPTSVVCSHQELRSVRQTMYGLAVVIGEGPPIDDSLHVLQVGGRG